MKISDEGNIFKMALVNYSTREIHLKIVYYGPGLGGKTTNLQWIYDHTQSKNKGKLISLQTETERTLFFDFLPLDFGQVKGFNTKFHLYTVPGQVFYNASRKLILKNVDGIVFVADSQKERMEANLESMDNLQENLLDYGVELYDLPFVLQFNKRDLPNIAEVEDLNRLLNPTNVPSFESVATMGHGVFETLKSICRLLLLTLKKDIRR